MKKNLILLCCALTAMAVQAREPAARLSLETTVGTALDMSKPASTPFLWQIKGYYHPSARWALGAGTGVSCYEKTLIPLFATARFNLTRPRKLTPYLECGVGYGFAPGHTANGGLQLSPSVGVRLRVLRHAFLVSVGYELQKLERLKEHTSPDFSVGFQEGLSHHALSLRLGFAF